ncbi:hypothetical protein IVA78_00905 [Bradyrhizobium sp. 137]|uniref:hypothetical protein n=1 Tax=Bradyrhizobium sp. 137 TaxID=2782614 RepID=UPI001FFB7E2E|nr:hypothetical protein [Bradyrhizobium sp. 137]MCK1753818.1 hypothetical protein [Bradyrhizobium sp. 137]
MSDKVEVAYRGGDRRAKRRPMMGDWATYCSKPPAEKTDKVVPIRDGRNRLLLQ